MQAANDILRMLESVDVNDTDTLDEIDEKFLAFLFGMSVYELHTHVAENERFSNLTFQSMTHGLLKHKTLNGFGTNYTRSLNDCQSAMPEGWNFYMSHNCGIYTFVLHKGNSHDIEVYGDDLPTMELAWLHAIISAMIWEIEND